MNDIVIIWDDQDDRDGNHWHICVEGHGLTREEIEEVLRDEESEIEVSRSSGRPTAFGWTSSGEQGTRHCRDTTRRRVELGRY